MGSADSPAPFTLRMCHVASELSQNCMRGWVNGSGQGGNTERCLKPMCILSLKESYTCRADSTLESTSLN